MPQEIMRAATSGDGTSGSGDLDDLPHSILLILNSVRSSTQSTFISSYFHGQSKSDSTAANNTY